MELSGLKAFLAHDDIEPTQEWEGVIIDNLKDCDVFIPLLSENFKESTWTDQETGIAVSEEKLIIPLKIDIDPYGFIGARAHQANKSHTCRPCASPLSHIVRPDSGARAS